MAKNWYPVIDYSICIECGTCVSKCPHGVYDVKKAPVPVVANPVSCVDHCHGCGNRCPVGAIQYLGEDTGWTPPNGATLPDEPGCHCGDDETAFKNVLVEYLYLDLDTCDRCVGFEQELTEVINVLAPALQLAGYAIEYRRIRMATRAIAERYRFVSSPTVRVNGRDLCASVSENNCGCCSEISGAQVDCRVYEYGGETYEVPPRQMIAEAMLTAIFGSDGKTQPETPYELPENLKKFFDGIQSKSGCGCSGGCCG